MLAFIPILLGASSIATAAAIPPALIAKLQDSRSSESAWESTDSAQALSTEPTNQNSEVKLNNFAKRTPYYFSETVPDEEEIADDLFAPQEAGTVNNSPNGHEMVHEGVRTGQSQQLKSIGTPNKEIDILHVPLLSLSDSDQDISPELAQSLEVSSSHYVGQNNAADIQSQVQAKTVQIDWVLSDSSQMIVTTPPFVPSMLILFFIAALLCIVTVVRGVRYRR